MKKIILKLKQLGKIPTYFISCSLALSAIYCAAVLTYCIILDSKDQLFMREIFMLRSVLEHLAATASLGVALGLLIDLVIKK